MEQQIKFRKNLHLKRAIFSIMIVATFFIIFNFSSQDGKKSTGVSYNVTTTIVKTVVKDKNVVEKLVKEIEPVMRKIAHFTIYMVVGFALMGLFCTFNLSNMSKIAYSLLIGIVYASSDEIHQIFTPDRGPSVLDVGIDTMGVVTGILIMIMFAMITQKCTSFDLKTIKNNVKQI